MKKNIVFFAVLLLHFLTGTAQRYVDNSGGGCGGNSPCYTTIQAAVTAATSGQTISVYPGTYNELVTIEKSLTLQSVSGKAVTTISYNATGNYLAPIMIQADAGSYSNITIGGTVNKGFTIVGIDNTNDAAGAGMEASAIIIGSNSANTISNIDISHNTITSNGEAGLLTYYKGSSLYNTITVHHNLFNGKTYVGTPVAGGLFTHFNTPKYALGINPGVSNFTLQKDTIYTQTGQAGIGRGSMYAEPAGMLIKENIFKPTFDGFATRAILLIGGSSAVVECNYFSMANAGAATLYVNAVTLPASYNAVTVAAQNTFAYPGGVIITAAPDLIGINTAYTGTAANSANPPAGCIIVLPLHEVSLSATLLSLNTYTLSWKTLNETETNNFELQASIDGIHFATVNTIKAKGNGNNTYKASYLANAGIIYLRIKQNSIFNTESNYSNTISLNNKADKSIAVYPNPFSDNLIVTGLATVNRYTINLYNSMGQLVYTENNIGTGTLHIEKLPVGLYHYTILNNEQVVVKNGRLLKKD